MGRIHGGGQVVVFTFALGCGANVVFVDDGAGTGASNVGGAGAGPPANGGSSFDGCLNGACGGSGELSCERANAAGFDLISTLTYETCGCEAGSPCEIECSADDVCVTLGPHSSTDACGECVKNVASTGQAPCAANAALGEACQSDTSPGGCADYVLCVLMNQ